MRNPAAPKGWLKAYDSWDKPTILPCIPRCQGQLCSRGEPLVVTRLGVVGLGSYRGIKHGNRATAAQEENEDLEFSIDATDEKMEYIYNLG